MNTHPIDPRALKAAEEIATKLDSDFGFGLMKAAEQWQEPLARIIQSHFAESVNGKLLQAAQASLSWLGEKPGDDKDTPYENSLRAVMEQLEQSIALAQSQPPSMADDLIELLSVVCGNDCNCSDSKSSVYFECPMCKAREIVKIHKAQKGQS